MSPAVTAGQVRGLGGAPLSIPSSLFVPRPTAGHSGSSLGLEAPGTVSQDHWIGWGQGSVTHLSCRES